MEGVTIPDKHLKLVLSMFALFLNLMLNTDNNLAQGRLFEEFMTNFNLQTKSNK